MFGFGVLPYLTLFIYSYICFLLFCIQFDLNFSAHPALSLLSEFLAVTLPRLWLIGFLGSPSASSVQLYGTWYSEQLKMQLSA